MFTTLNTASLCVVLQFSYELHNFLSVIFSPFSDFLWSKVRTYSSDSTDKQILNFLCHNYHKNVSDKSSVYYFHSLQMIDNRYGKLSDIFFFSGDLDAHGHIQLIRLHLYIKNKHHLLHFSFLSMKSHGSLYPGKVIA